MSRTSVRPVPAAPMCCPPIGGAPLTAATRWSWLAASVPSPIRRRLRILSLIASAEAGEICVCDLVDPVGKSQPTVSHHLKVLSEAGLIAGDKRGRWVWYRAVPTRLADLRGALA